MASKYSGNHNQGKFFNDSHEAPHITGFPDYNSKIQAVETVIRQLRANDLNQGHCFMYFDERLPEGQAYYEYPDGCIRIEKLEKNNFDIPRVVVKILSRGEAERLRNTHALIQ